MLSLPALDFLSCILPLLPPGPLHMLVLLAGMLVSSLNTSSSFGSQLNHQGVDHLAAQ